MQRPRSRYEDAELALRTRSGQEWAFEQLLDRHRDVIQANARNFFAIGETHEDLLQEARFALYTAAITFDPSRGSSFRSFAQLVIRARLTTALKTATRGKHGPLNDSARFETVLNDDGMTLADLLPAPSQDEPEERAIAREDLQRFIRVCNTRLSELERIVLARRLKGLSLAECGAGLGTASRRMKTADNALCRIRRKLAA